MIEESMKRSSVADSQNYTLYVIQSVNIHKNETVSQPLYHFLENKNHGNRKVLVFRYTFLGTLSHYLHKELFVNALTRLTGTFLEG